MSGPAPTFGARAVGLDFNPSGDPMVTETKQAFADIIDHLDHLRTKSLPEQARLASIAITEAENACMWAVKAFTAPFGGG